MTQKTFFGLPHKKFMVLTFPFILMASSLNMEEGTIL